MRVPDSVCNAAIGVSQIFGKFDLRGPSKGLREDQGFTLLQVLEGYDGKKIYRFEAPRSSGSVVVKDARGRDVPFDFVELGEKTSDDADTRMISLAIPSAVRTFWVSSQGANTTRVGHLEVRALEVKRNCLMVNPSIDSLYPSWLKQHERRSKIDALDDCGAPKFSIITPLYNTPVGYFFEMVDSVLSQIYENWELVLVNASPQNEELRQALEALDDGRIVVVELGENKGISENTLEGIKASSGDYISFLDHDDTIEPNALSEYASAIVCDGEIDLLYCDEDSITHDGSKRFKPLFKFDFNKDLLLSHNYVCHMLTVSRRAFDQIIPYDSSVDGAQDYDLTLKVSRVARKIKHIPKILYHWRQHSGSTNGGSTEVKPYVVDASIKALSEHLREDDIAAEIVPTDIPCVFETEYPRSSAGDVSVVIVYENPFQLIECLSSLAGAQMDSVEELIAIGPKIDVERDLMIPLGIEPHDSDLKHQAQDYMTAIAGISVRLLESAEPSFSFAANAGVEHAANEYILLLSAGVRLDQDNDFITRLRAYLCREDVGIVSAKIMSTDNLVYHAGLCIKEDGSIGYLNQGFIEGMGGGYHGCAECSCDYSAVDSSCIAFRKSDFEGVGRLSTEYGSQLASSVDLSFKMRATGKKIVVAPQARVRIQPIKGNWILGESYLPLGDKDHEILWSKWDEGYRRDILAHPDIDLSSSYFRLRV